MARRQCRRLNRCDPGVANHWSATLAGVNAQPRLLETRVPPRPEAAVLVLHGGANRPGNPMVSPTQLSVLRMIPVARRIARAGDDRLAVFRLLNSVRGWDSQRTPVADVEWALGLLAERFGADLPIGLVGHSLGGRAALLAGHATPYAAWSPSTRGSTPRRPPTWRAGGC